MKIELIAYTQPFAGFDEPAWGNPLKIVEQCASVCYDSKPTEDLQIAKSCAESGHWSTWEHISFTFYISGVSRSLLAQLSRHRHISLAVQSQRYVRYENDIDCISPKFKKIASNAAFDEAIRNAKYAYDDLLAFGELAEDARSILPNACCTKLYMTANARALIEMSHLRLCNRAQSEIRTMFEELKKQVALVAPEVADYMRPKCEIDKEHPFCTERQCCGKHKKLGEVYNDM